MLNGKPPLAAVRAAPCMSAFTAVPDTPHERPTGAPALPVPPCATPC
jgi:hypothetical protein